MITFLGIHPLTVLKKKKCGGKRKKVWKYVHCKLIYNRRIKK